MSLNGKSKSSVLRQTIIPRPREQLLGSTKNTEREVGFFILMIV